MVVELRDDVLVVPRMRCPLSVHVLVLVIVGDAQFQLDGVKGFRFESRKAGSNERKGTS